MAGCPSCGAVPPSPDSRFCDRCGAPLAAASGAASQGAQARKVVTVLFADLVGSTAAQERMDPESVRRWLDRYYAVVRGEIEGGGGRVVKFIGDGVMAVFGVPEVREDDAHRAVAAARAMQGAVAELGGPGGAPGVGLRVGVNTGEVVVTADDDDVVGDVVNVAARLEQAARPGEVLVGEATFRLVRTVAQLRAVAPLELKGKSEPVPAFLLQSLERTEEDASTSPFVGRAGELERLAAVLDVAIGDRHPQMASVVGTPGVGKSRLVRELGAAAADRARVVVVRCDPAGGATFAPVATALRAAASLEDDASDETVLAGLTALFDEDEPDRNRIARSAAAVLGVGDPGLPEETFWAVRRLVENAAARRPMVFVFEDVHWAEPLLLDLIEHLATFTRDIPLLLVLTARPELREQRPALLEVGGRVTAAIHLEGLAVDESRRLTRALLDGATLPAALLDRVAAASEGNPLFVRELVRMLVDDGVLRQSDSGWTASVDARTVEVPLSIHAVLAARIDRLPPAEQEVLGAASILGRTFARGAVLHLVDSAVGERLDEHLEGLRRKELLERTGTQWLDEPQLRFHHALVQDAAYRRLLKEARADLHERAAEWLEAKVGALAEHDDLIGFQLEQAHLLRGEAGLEGDDLGRSAAARLRAAGRRSLEADDRPGAASLLGRALACLPDDDAARADILIERCEALLAMGDVTEAAPVVSALAAFAPGDARLEGWAACFEGELANLRDPRHLGDTVLRAEGAAATLDALGDHAGAAKAHAVRAASLARLGRIGECEQALDKALGAARSAGDRRRATAILAGAPSAALWGPNPVTRASGRCLDVVRVLRITSRAPAVEAISLRCQAVLEALRGRDDAARRMLASARTSLEELGHALGLIEVDLASGMVETLAGDLEGASAHLGRALEGFHELGIDVDAGLAAALLARVRIAQGMPTEALELTRESERLGGDDLKTSIAWRSVRAAALADEGDLTEARRLAEEAVALAESTDALVDHADALVALAEVLAHAGDEEGSVAAARRAIELYERKEASVPAANARWLLGAEVPGGTASPAHAPADDPGPLTTLAPTRRSLVTEVITRVTAAMSPFDRPALEALLAPGLVNLDRRPVVGSDEPLDLLEAAEITFEMGVEEVRSHIRAIRGDRLALLESTFALPAEGSDNSGNVKIVQVQEATEDGRVIANLWYEPEHDAGAWVELERRYCDSLPPAQAEVWRVGASMLGAMGRRDWQAMTATIAEDLVAVDHRPSGWGTVGREDFVELYRGSVALAPDAWFGFHDVVAITDRGVVGEAAGIGNTVDGGEFRTAASAVLQVADGRVSRVDYFPADRMDLAIALLEERSGAKEPLENAATRSGNRASSLNAELMALGFAGRYDEVAARARSDLRIADHRPIVGGTVEIGRERYLELVRTLIEVGVTSIEPDIWGLRGDGLALGSFDYLGDGGSAAVLEIVEVDADGWLAANDTYELDQEAEAWAELERRYCVQLPPPESAVWSVCTASLAARVAGDWELARSFLTDDFVAVDHRSAGWDSLDRDGYIGLHRSAADLVPGSSVRFVDVLLVTPHGVAARAHRTGSTQKGEELHSPFVVASCVVDGRIARTEYFPANRGDLAIACARSFDRRGLPVENAVTRMYDREVRRVLAGDPDALGEVVDDLVSYDHRPLVGVVDVIHGKEVAREWLRGLAELGFDSSETEVLAVRGQRLGLVVSRRHAGDSTLELLVTVEADAIGRGTRIDVYDPSQLDDAMADLDERYAQVDLPEPDRRAAWEGVRRMLHALNVQDVEALGASIADDGALEDHRPNSWGTVDRDQWIGIYPQDWRRSPDVRWHLRQVHRLSGTAIYGDLEMHGTREGGSFATPVIVGASLRDGRVSRVHLWVPEDRAEAEAWFTAASGGASTGTLRNLAVDLFERARDLSIARDFDAYADLIHSDTTFTDHRPVVGGYSIVGRDAYVDIVRAIVDMGTVQVRGDVLAVRGQRHCLVRAEFSGAAGLVENLTLLSFDSDRRMVTTDVFEVDQLAEAVALLDERFPEELPAAAADVWRPALGFLAALGSRDLARIGALLSDDYVLHDHRPMGFGDLYREAYLASFVPAYESSPDIRWFARRDLGWRGDTVFADIETSGTRDGGAFRTSLLGVLHIRAGQLAVLEVFAAEDLAAATAHFEGLDDGPVPRAPADRSLHDLDTDATAQVRRAREVLLSEGIEAYSAMIADSVVCIDHRPMPGGYRIDGHGPFVEAVRGLLEVGVTSIEDEILAVRGDRLCLSNATHHGTSGVVVVLQVIGLDEDGLLSTVDVFEADALDQAVEALDERYIAGEGRAAATTLEVALGFMRALGGRDLAAVEAFLADDLIYEDHRPLGFGRLDRAAYLASMPPAWESSSDIRWLVRRLFGTVGRSSLGSVDVFGTGAGGEFHSPLLGIPTVRDGKIEHLEIFPIDERAAAEARFAELTAEPDANMAVQVITRTMALLLAGQIEEAAERYGPDMVMEDHRPIIGGLQLEGRDAFEPMAGAIVDWGFDRWTWSIVEVHGDRLALVRAVFGDGAREVEALLLAEADDLVRYRRLDVFDTDQLELARAILADRTAPTERPVRQALIDYAGCVAAQDVPGLRARFSPDGVLVDARPVVGGEFRGEELQQALGSLSKIGIIGFDWSPLASRGERLELTRATASGPGAALDLMILWRTGDDGTLDRIEIYDPEQLAAAVTRLEELFMEGEGAGSECWRLFVASFAAMNARDIEALREVVREDLTVVDHRPLGWGELDREGYLGLYPPIFEQSPDVRWRIMSVQLVTPQVVVATVAVNGGYGDSGDFDIQFASVLQTSGARGARLEIFPLEDEPAALARGRELAR